MNPARQRQLCVEAAPGTTRTRCASTTPLMTAPGIVVEWIHGLPCSCCCGAGDAAGLKNRRRPLIIQSPIALFGNNGLSTRLSRLAARRTPLSPCINICSLDERGYCIGCLRSLAEIALLDGDEHGATWQVLEAVERAAGTRARQREPEAMNRGSRGTIKQQLQSAAGGAVHEGHAGLPQCGFSAQTVAALRACGAEFAHVNIFEDPELREALKAYSNWPTYPQLYVNGELVGGCDIALEMYGTAN